MGKGRQGNRCQAGMNGRQVSPFPKGRMTGEINVKGQKAR